MNARVLLPLLLLGCRPPVPSMPAAAAAVALEAGLAGEPLPSLRYNQVFRIATHNSYWVRRDPAIEIEASGVQERILDQLLV